MNTFLRALILHSMGSWSSKKYSSESVGSVGQLDLSNYKWSDDRSW